MTFSHLDADQRPTMVDVSGKVATERSATAEARVHFPAAVAAALRENGLRSPKGPVFDTAIVAGVLGAKRTHELIPFCHPLGLESCRIVIDLEGDAAIIRCTVGVHHKTGVEMEALTGASIAALTIYDMCKALSHDIVIGGVRLLAKDGGKSTLRGGAVNSDSIYGLILAGGTSTRMQRDKAALTYQGRTQLDRAFEVLSRCLQRVFVSVRADQTSDPTRAHLPMIVDSVEGAGPIVGIRSALAAHPNVAWFVLACDLPFFSQALIDPLVRARDAHGVAASLATAYKSAHDGLPEPLCAIWEPAAAPPLADYAAAGGRCPRKFLIRHSARLLDLPDNNPLALDNVNTPEEYSQAAAALDSLAPMQLKIHYYALMREQAGRSEETLETSAATPAELYTELAARYGFTLSLEQLKVAVNSEFSDWSRKLAANDAVVFIPPVAGG